MPLEDLTHDDLDAVADQAGVEDYPSSGNKDEKVAALEAAGVPDDATPDEPEQSAVERRAATEVSGLDPALKAAREATAKAEAAAAEIPDGEDAPPVRPVGSTVGEQTPVSDPDGTMAKAKADARKIEGADRDTREGPTEV